MNVDVLNNTFFGNSLYQWIIACAIIIGALLAGRVIYWLIGKTVKRLAARTPSSFAVNR